MFLDLTQQHGQSSRKTYQVYNSLALLEDLILLVDLAQCMSETLLELHHAMLITSKSLNAARLFRPWTLASLANLSLPCLFCHRFVEEEEFRMASVHGDAVYCCVCQVGAGYPSRDGSV